MPANLGLTGAVQTGMLYAYENGYYAAIQIDGDGQHDPRNIRKMAERMEETDEDLVIGSRFVTEKKPRSLRMLGNTIIEGAIRLTTGKNVTAPTFLCTSQSKKKQNGNGRFNFLVIIGSMQKFVGENCSLLSGAAARLSLENHPLDDFPGVTAPKSVFTQFHILNRRKSASCGHCLFRMISPSMKFRHRRSSTVRPLPRKP